MLECWGCGLYTSAAYTRVFTVFYNECRELASHLYCHYVFSSGVISLEFLHVNGKTAFLVLESNVSVSEVGCHEGFCELCFVDDLQCPDFKTLSGQNMAVKR